MDTMMWECGNPFSTRFVRPGSLPFLFPAGHTASKLVDRLRRTNWWGQIVGPHGAGKSTLLHTLQPHLVEAGKQLVWVSLHAGQRRIPPELAPMEADRWSSKVVVIVDGYEQLSWFARHRLKNRCRRTHAGLLVTCHTNMGFPMTYQVAPDLPTVRMLTDHLLEHAPTNLTEEDVTQCFQAWNGNVREVFFALYDLYELRTYKLRVEN